MEKVEVVQQVQVSLSPQIFGPTLPRGASGKLFLLLDREEFREEGRTQSKRSRLHQLLDLPRRLIFHPWLLIWIGSDLSLRIAYGVAVDVSSSWFGFESMIFDKRVYGLKSWFGFEAIFVDDFVYGGETKGTQLSSREELLSGLFSPKGEICSLWIWTYLLQCISKHPTILGAKVTYRSRQSSIQMAHSVGCTAFEIRQSIQVATPWAALPLKSGACCRTAHKPATRGYGDSGLSVVQQHLGSTNRKRGLGYLRPPGFDWASLDNSFGPRRHKQGSSNLSAPDL